MKPFPFGVRVLIAAAVPAVVTSFILVWYFTQSRLSDLEAELRERGTAIARQLAPAAEFGIFSGNREILEQLVSAATRERDVIGAAIIERTGVVLASSGRLVPPATPRTLPPEARMQSGDGRTLIFTAPVGLLQAAAEDIFTQNLPGADGTRAPLGTVVVVLSRDDVELRKNELIASAIALTGFGLLLAALIARALAMQVTRPVQRLAEVVSDLKEGNLDARAAGGASGVLHELEAGINEMADALQESRRNLERRVAEATHELQEEKERAEEANRAKTQFLAAASHDLRQPLQAAGLFVGSLRLRNKDPDVAALIDRVERALGSLEGVLEALLDISRLDAGVVQPRIERFPVANVLHALQETFAAPAAQHGAELRIRPSSLWCESDPGLLERILANLVSNGLRYCEKGRVLVACRPSGSGLRIEVRDNGPGIPRERQQDIFREFIQLDNPARSRDKGLGLGLAIVERLARLLGHRIQLRSENGRGSTFSLLLARVAPQWPAAQSLEAEILMADLSGKRILVLEDDDEVREALALFLSSHGAVPLLAKNVAHALMLASTEAKPHLVISDYRLGPGEQGIAAIRMLRARFASGVPRIILTGDTSPAVLQEVTQAGFAMISKPVRHDELLRAISAALRPD
jgi:signal transduction histidine kinase/ActR/RegA family two-component response regulator